ncbi:hypothetical protein [Halanaerobium congolense]|jgi:hypothetical protein|uniref:Uncharacterized protein n=1 Tax=Halanaerobium congolense TaxID=54121 RepID=A0A1G6SXM7_9FIRM|nr:hypothetical protein [Halanaerobium congolense]SDD21364.1 hypothetical protein SAMN04488597_1345 [Halanaerobium congolense]
MNKLLIDEYPLMVLPTFAKEIGLKNAIFVQQIHFLTQTKQQNNDIYTYKNGHMWVYNTINEWHKNYFSFMSKSTLKRVIKNCEDDGYIISTDEFNKSEYDKTKWYRINYEKISEIQKEIEKEIEEKREEKLKKAEEKKKRKKEQVKKMKKIKFNEKSNLPLGQNDTMPENTVFLPLGQNEPMPEPEASGQNEPIDQVKMNQPIPYTTTYTSLNNKNNKKNKFQKIENQFKKAFSVNLNSFQFEKIKEYMLNGLSEQLILKTIEHCGLGGHNQAFFFNRLSMLVEDEIYTVDQLNSVLSQANTFKNNANNSKNESKENEQKSKESNYKWKDFFIDFDKYKE